MREDLNLCQSIFIRAKARYFQIIDGKLMPPFSTIDGMGDKAAEAVEDAAKDGPYLSKDDFRQRTKVSKTVIDLMRSWILWRTSGVEPVILV